MTTKRKQGRAAGGRVGISVMVFIILHIDVAALLSAHLDNVYANLMKEVESSEDEDESRVRKVQLKYLCL